MFVDKQGGLKEVEFKVLILVQYQVVGIVFELVDLGVIIIIGESVKICNVCLVVMVFLQLLGDFVVVSVGLYLELVIVGYGVGV